MVPVEIKKGIYWVGVIDWGVRNFHGFTYNTARGTTYNAYLIVDEKVAVVDTVFGPFAEDFVSKIKDIVPLEKIDYVIANHVETDHSGALPELMRLCPKAKVVGTAKCKEGLWRNYYGDWDFQVVKTGDTIKLGRRSLTFIEAPMIHWPDSMFSYCPEEGLLLPNDAFGQHYASSGRFDDEVDQCALMDEAAKYYANILLPLGGVISKKLEELKKMNLFISMIAPSHGVIWRREPQRIVEAYSRWANNQTHPKVVIVYETMWQATEKMAFKISQGLGIAGVEHKVFNIGVSSVTEVVKELLEAKGIIVGSSTHDNSMLNIIAGFLHFLKGLKPRNRIGACFGSYGWQGGAIKEMEAALKEVGIEQGMPSLGFQYLPDEQGFQQCVNWGKGFGELVLNENRTGK